MLFKVISSFRTIPQKAKGPKITNWGITVKGPSALFDEKTFNRAVDAFDKLDPLCMAYTNSLFHLVGLIVEWSKNAPLESQYQWTFLPTEIQTFLSSHSGFTLGYRKQKSPANPFSELSDGTNAAHTTIKLTNHTNPASNNPLDKYLGQGGFGKVRVGETTGKIAIKKIDLSRLMKSETAKVDFGLYFREVQVGSQLDHPNIVPIQRAYLAFGRKHTLKLYNVMKYVDGKNLFDLISNRCIPLDQVFDGYLGLVQCMLDIAKGIQYLHQRRIIHMDLKPENVLFTSKHPNTFSASSAYVCDLGAMSSECFEKVEKDRAKGTLGYTAPEILEDSPTVTTKNDIWGLGVLFYIMLTKRHPYAIAENPYATYTRTKNPDMFPQFAQKHLETCKTDRQKSRNPEHRMLYNPLTSLIQNMLAFKPNQRPPIGDVIEVLESVRMKLA